MTLIEAHERFEIDEIRLIQPDDSYPISTGAWAGCDVPPP